MSFSDENTFKLNSPKASLVCATWAKPKLLSIKIRPEQVSQGRLSWLFWYKKRFRLKDDTDSFRLLDKLFSIIYIPIEQKSKVLKIKYKPNYKGSRCNS